MLPPGSRRWWRSGAQRRCSASTRFISCRGRPKPSTRSAGPPGTTLGPLPAPRLAVRRAGRHGDAPQRGHRQARVLKHARYATVFALKGRAGKEALDRWVIWARRCRIPIFVALQRRIVTHRAAIDASLDNGLSNALIESINAKIRAPHPHRLRVQEPRSPHRPRLPRPRRPPTPTPRPNMTHGRSRRAPFGRGNEQSEAGRGSGYSPRVSWRGEGGVRVAGGRRRGRTETSPPAAWVRRRTRADRRRCSAVGA